jgi:hypothetical protein
MPITYSPNALMNTDYFNFASGQDISGDPDETNLMIIVNMVSSIFEIIVGRPLISAEYSYIPTILDKDGITIIPNPAYDPVRAILDGPKSKELWLPVWPVTEIKTLQVNGTTITEQPMNYFNSDNTEDDGYFLYPTAGKIYYTPGFYHPMKRNVYLDYIAGYTTDSDEYLTLQYLCYQSVVKLMNLDPLLGDIDSEKLMDYQYKKIDPKVMDKYKGLIPEVWRFLQAYKRTVFA